MAPYKILGQVNPTTTSLTDLYEVPTSKEAFCSTLSVCNQGAVTSTVRVAVRQNGDALVPKQYIIYDTQIVPQDSLFLTVGLSLFAGDIVSVNSATSSLSFNLFGTEI